MAENYTIAEATIVSIGDIQQVHFEDKKTGKPSVFTKFEFVCQVGDVQTTLEGNGYNRDKLEVGARYSFEVQGKDDFNDSIRKLTRLEGDAAPAPTPQAKPVETPKPVPAAIAPKPDLPARWREYNSNARNAQIQATDRTGKYIDLLIAGKLTNEAGEVIDKVRKSTVENWYSEEMNRYWHEHEVFGAKDAYGWLDGGDNDNS